MRLLRTLAPVACVLAVVVTRPAPFAALTAGAERTLHRAVGEKNIICRLYLDPHDKFTRVVAPARMSMSRTGQAEAAAVLSTITVNYTGFTGTNGPAAQAAFQAAVDVWETQVASAVPIVVDADFRDLGTGGLLGSAGSGAASSSSGAGGIRANTFYPAPLLNKIFGSNVYDQNFGAGSSNIGADFNSNGSINWYFGTDGVVPAGKVDFMSVVLHEIGHGLGFFGGASVSGGVGTLGSSGLPFIYDTFVADAATAGNLLINLPNGSATMAAALTGNSEYWDGPQGKTANSGARPRLYAPSTFQNGSSHSHLNDATYPPGNINSLMTPSIGTAEAIHTPGPITLGMFADMGWGSNTGSSCSFGLDRTSASVAAAGGTVPVTLSTATGCAWTASTAASFVSIAPAASGTGSQAFTLTVAAHTGVSPRVATVTIGGQTLTITQAGTGPTMSLDKTSLIFTGVSTGAAFTSKTSAQTVRLTQSGSGTVSWTATASPSWLSVSPASGSGSATLNLSVNFQFGLNATQAGTVTLTFNGAGNTAGPINVTLNVVNSAQAAAPQGAFDTPANNTTGIAGSIPVTGWAIDDVEVTGVRIMRDPVAGEAAGQLVFIGNAVLVDGARPDVQALFPTSPRSTRAGWGYLMLTNFLPGLGNGTYRLVAIADDADGHSTILGSKTITCSNSSSVAPFGAIDTPGQGETISGSNYANFGWVLSPGTTRRSDPPSGGEVRVVIDGVIGAQPGGWVSRSDLTGLFPASQFAGVGNALGAIGINTTLLTNGVHTISWLVTDNLGTASGIGSRYFTVSNGSALTAGSTAEARSFTSANFGHRSLTAEVNEAPSDVAAIRGRRGYNIATPIQPYAFRNGVATIQSEELDRIELRLSRSAGHSYAGYVRANGALAPLPIGSSLNASTGLFTWQPGVGFVGSYDLVFVRWANGRAVAKQDVRVVLNPKGSNRVGPQVVIDLPAKAGSYQSAATADVTQGFIVAGWAADLDSATDAGVDAVHVWAYPAAGPSTHSTSSGQASSGQAAPIFVGPAAVGGTRPDVAAVYGERFAKSGYGIRVKGLAPGTYDIAVFAYSTVTGGFVPAKVVRVIVK